MSIEAESREKKYRKNSRHQQYGTSMDPTSVRAMIRLCYLACHRLHKALRAVPDDLKTRSALADAYLSEYWAHMQVNITIDDPPGPVANPVSKIHPY